MNYKIVIDPGHGGLDPGAINGNLKEKDFTLRVSKYMYDKFKSLGIPVKLTRDSDETLSKTERVKRILNSFGNNSDVILISNHINAGGGDGAEVIYALRNKETLSKSILNNIAKKGQNIRSFYQRRLPSDSTKDYYFIHRETGKLEPVLVEYGFIDSKKDDINQLKNNIESYGDAVIESVLDYIGYKPIDNVNNDTYIVKSGDTLYSIAKMYNLDIDDIIKTNNLGTTVLKIGQKLVLPISGSSSDESYNNFYIVKPGDTLWSIAKNNNISVDELKSINNLNSNMLSIDQKLILPDLNSNIYTVKSGDSLWSIAKMYNINVNDLINYNNLDNTLLKIGQKLLIP